MPLLLLACMRSGTPRAADSDGAADSDAPIEVGDDTDPGDSTPDHTDTAADETDTGDLPVLGGLALEILEPSPSDGSCLRSEEFDVRVRVTADDGDLSGVLVSFRSFTDGLLVPPTAPDADGVWAAHVTVSWDWHGLLWKATDPRGHQARASVSVQTNRAPSTSGVAIRPDPAVAGEGLSAITTASSSDPDGDALFYNYAWEVDGTPFATGSSNVVATGTTQSGETWTVRVTASDTCGPGGEAVASVVIQ